MLCFWFPVKDEPVVKMPLGAVILHVAAGYLGVGPKTQPTIELWAHGSHEAPRVARRLRVAGTGHLADVDPATHIGTVIHDLPGGRGVWHVFDLGEAP